MWDPNAKVSSLWQENSVVVKDWSYEGVVSWRTQKTDSRAGLPSLDWLLLGATFFLVTFLQLLTCEPLNKSAFVSVFSPFAFFHALILHVLSRQFPVKRGQGHSGLAGTDLELKTTESVGWGFCSRDIWAPEATQVLGAMHFICAGLCFLAWWCAVVGILHLQLSAVFPWLFSDRTLCTVPWHKLYDLSNLLCFFLNYHYC